MEVRLTAADFRVYAFPTAGFPAVGVYSPSGAAKSRKHHRLAAFSLSGVSFMGDLGEGAARLAGAPSVCKPRLASPTRFTAGVRITNAPGENTMTKSTKGARTPKPATQSHDFEPVFTNEQVYQNEHAYNKTWGMKRRLTMVILARSKASLVDGFRPDPETLLAAIEQIAAYRDHLQAGAKMAASAMARLLIVGQIFADEELLAANKNDHP